MNNSNKSPIGRARGPGTNTFEFEFVTSDKDKVRVGEFVYYNYIEPSTSRTVKILCRVIKRNPLRLYPDVLLSNPNLDPKFIADTIGLPNSDELDFYLITAQIIGYYKDNNFKFVNPRLPPAPGAEIYLADGYELEQWINPYQADTTRSAYIGNLLTRTNENVKICLDVNKIVSTHLAVLAATGSGKSYSVGVLIEEMMMPKNRAAILVIDPHAEYLTLKQIETKSEFYDKTINYRPIVKILNSKDIHIKLSTLKFEEFMNILKRMSDKMEHLFYKVYKNTVKNKPNFTLDDLQKGLDSIISNEKNIEMTIMGIKWRLDEYIGNKSIISDINHLYLRDILKPGQLTIMNVSDLRKEDQQLLVNIFLRRILHSRISYTQSKIGFKLSIPQEDLLDYPVFIILEEGHRFAPANEDSWSKEILKTILSEGRKFGVGICIISQRPGKLDSDVLSQCMSQIIMRIKNPIDQKNIRDSVESVSDDIIEDLPSLTMGQAVIAGECINTPVLVNIRQRITKHGGESLNSVEEWLKYKSSSSSQKILIDNQNEPLD